MKVKLFLLCLCLLIGELILYKQMSTSTYHCFLSFLFTATVVKSEAGSLPEGKVKIKLEHDGTILDVDEDDVERVSVK